MSERPVLAWVHQYAVTPADGGGTRHVELARELVRRGWRVIIHAADINLHQRTYTRRAGPEDRRVIAENVDGVEFRWYWTAPYERNDWKRGRNWLSFATEVTRHAHAEGRPDVVIGSSPQPFAALGGWRLAQRLGVPFVLEIRDLWPETLLAAGSRKGPFYVALAVLMRFLYARARRVIVLAAGTREYLAVSRVAPERLVLIPNGVDLTMFAATERAERETMQFVYAGAHGPLNGLDVLIEAAALVADDPRLHFRLVGDGAAKAELQAMAAARKLTNVTFDDPVPKREMTGVLADADVGLMLLKSADLFSFGVSPNKLFDYCAAGLPVVCNVPGEVAALVAEAGAGEQTANGGAPALAAAIRAMAARAPSSRAALGRAARAWVERERDRTILAERLDRVLHEVRMGARR
jgi:glycosyltransferase involved in cell wall biosynthesis